ncbi:MAG: hypothetical protein FWD53_09840 [Phycisphaerales bacterium]|nr:hypothetical protein [Phycisphaerales bacterium]
MRWTWVARSLLTPSEIVGMAALYQRYYVGAASEAFACDLADKDFVALGQDATGCVTGFSTTKLIRQENLAVLFSGDTIVDIAARGAAGVLDAYLALMTHLLQVEKNMPLYWLLISKGPRTYRLLPAFFTRHYPGPNGDATLRLTLDLIAHSRFGIAYDSTTHLYRPPPPRDRLRPEHCDFNADDAAMQWFDQANPQWRDGIELCALAPITLDNFTPLGRRRAVRVTVDWRG